MSRKEEDIEITIVFYFRGTRDILGMKHDLNSHKDCWYTLLSDATYRVGHGFFHANGEEVSVRGTGTSSESR